MDRRAWVVSIGILVLVAVPGLADLTGRSFLIDAVTRFVIYGIAAVSLDLVLGYGALISFGHAAFFGLGGYVVAILGFYLDQDTGLLAWLGTDSALVVWPLAMLLSAMLGLVIGWLSLRTDGIQFIMITLAFGQMVYFVLVGLVTFGGDDGLSISVRNTLPALNVDDPGTYYYVCLVLLVLWTWFCHRLVHSPFGMVLQGFRLSARRSMALGYEPMRYRLPAFVLSAMGTGLAGALWANYALYASPDMATWFKSGEFMAMIILGGMGTLFGPVLGAAAYLGLEQALTAWTENWMLFLGPILVLVVLYGRGGLLGLLVGRRPHA